MAHDKRRTVRLNISEEHASLIEAKFGLDQDANKADAVRTLIGIALEEKNEKQVDVHEKPPAINTAAAPPCGMNGADKTLRTLQATLEMFIQKYMADHPERTYSGDFLATMEARWRSFIEYKRPEYMEKAGLNAP